MAVEVVETAATVVLGAADEVEAVSGWTVASESAEARPVCY